MGLGKTVHECVSFRFLGGESFACSCLNVIRVDVALYCSQLISKYLTYRDRQALWLRFATNNNC